MGGTDSRVARRTEAAVASARRGRRARRLATTLIVGATVLAMVSAAVFFGVRAMTARGTGSTATVRVTVTPVDARIRFGSNVATGTLSATGVEPGEYRVRVDRTGFTPLDTVVVITRGQRADLRYKLEPHRLRFTLDLRPKRAAYVITCSDGSKLSGKGGFSGDVPAGKTIVRVSAPGTRTVNRTVFVERPTTVTEWLDPNGQLVHRVAVFKSVPAPKGVAFTPDGSQVWVTALVTQPSIAAYDPRTGKQLGSVDMGSSGAVEVMFSRDGTRAYASQMQSASVYEIDTRTFKVLRRMRTGSSWTKIVAMSPDQTRLYAANWSGDDISVISLKTGKLVKRIPTVDTPRGMWPTADGKRLFVAGFGENSGVGRLAVIDLKTGRSKTFFQQRGTAMRHMVADEKRGVLFTSDLGKDCIWTTDMKTLKTRRFFNTDRKPNTFDMSPDGRVLFISCRGENNPKSYSLPGPEWGTVLLFDAHSGKPLDAIIGGNQCTALDLSDDGTLLIFSDFLDSKMRTYEVPPYDTLVRGGGGLYLEHFKHIVKAGWPGWKGPSPN